MNKLRTARLLMAATILLIILFQAYWLRKLYQEEQRNFTKSADIIFRETMYRLQAERFTNDSMVFRGLPGDNLFMSDVMASVQKNESADSGQSKKRMTISLKTNESFTSHDSTTLLKRDTVMYVDTKEGGAPPPHIARFLENNKSLNDTISIKRIDSMYSALLAKEGIEVGFHIIKMNKPAVAKQGKIFTIEVNDQHSKTFITKKVPVGFLTPVYYSAEFGDATMFILKKISLQLLLSILLVALTTLSFVFIFKSLVAQKRLTEIKNEFIGNITHELKTPISTVSVAIEAMKNFNALQSPERTKEYLGIAGQELNRLSLLVDKVLRLSMFEKQQVELKYEWFDLKDLVKEVMDSMQLQFEKFGAVTKINLEGDDFAMMADRMHITSVVYNLLDNALKYSKDKPEVEVNIAAKEREMLLEVRDNGIGIPASYKEKVFDKFFRVPHGDKHNVKGYGLGLSYVAHIIAEHKGTVSVESEEGKGTTFSIKIPRENGGS